MPCWLDGTFHDREERLLGLDIGAFHYGVAVFEGILAVRSGRGGKEGAALFRNADHVKRLWESAAMLGLEPPYSKEETARIIKDAIRHYRIGTCYVRPVLFAKDDYTRLLPAARKCSFAVLLKPASFRLLLLKMRMAVSLMMFEEAAIPLSGRFASLKASGRYLVNALAKRQAERSGFTDALLFDRQGGLAEATSTNIFVIRKDSVMTPAPGAIINGITRRSVIDILHDSGYRVEERDIMKDELGVCDAAFLTGTAAGISPVGRIGKHRLNSRHRIIGEIRDGYVKMLIGQSGDAEALLDPVTP